MYARATEMPGVAASACRYLMSLTRSIDRERSEFMNSCLIAAEIAFRAAQKNPMSLKQLSDILEHNRSTTSKALVATGERMSHYAWDRFEEANRAWMNTVFGGEGETIADFMHREADVMSAVANFSEQVEAIKDEFGFHFQHANYRLVGETDGFLMYQVLPLKEGVTVRDDLKPMLLVPPYMLGAHILAFLPGEDKSYAHAFANEGIPTYVRVVKDIWETEAVQTMTPEDDCLQTADLCAQLVEKHGQKVTLNGTCQGGYICLMNILSGRLTEVCDTLITNVAPIDGTYSSAISGMPKMHEDFIMSTMPNGNEVANGYILSLGMRFVAIDRETPLVTVLNQAKLQRATNGHPGKTPAALFHWLRKDRVHLPPAIARMSSKTFQERIAPDGTLPVTLFEKDLNVRDLANLGVRWYQNYAVQDDLVTPKCATAANRFLDGTDVVESVAFYGGHVAILTSPYSRRSPVNGTFVDALGNEVRGPVKFQLDASPAQAVAA